MDWSTPRCKVKYSFGDSSRNFDWKIATKEQEKNIDIVTLSTLEHDYENIHFAVW